MTDKTLEQRIETREIPRFDIPSTKTRKDYLGRRVTISRAMSDAAGVSLHHLLNLLGPTFLKIFSWSDEHAPTPEDGFKILADILSLNFTADKTKHYVLAHAIPSLKERFAKLNTADVLFHVDNLIVGHMTIDDVPIRTRADLDETGITVTAMLPLLYDAIEVNYFPTSADPSIENGDAGSALDEAPTTNHKSQPSKRSSGEGVTKRAGRSGRIRKS